MKSAHRVQSLAKRRSRWPADPMAFQKVLNKLELFNDSELMRLELPIRMSFESLKSGKGTESDFHDIDAAICASLVRSRDVDPLCEQTALAAYNAMKRTHDRWLRTGRWGFDGPALVEVDEGISLHEELIRNSTPQQMLNALRLVVKRGRDAAQGVAA